MHRRLLASLLAIAFVAVGQGQSLTVQKLIDFVHSQIKVIKDKKGTDAELAKYLATFRLTEKLEESVIEDLQADGAGPLTVKALQRLQDQSKSLKAAVIQKPVPDDPIPIPTSVEQGEILDQARQYVANYDNDLPDFICTEFEERMVGPKRIARNNGEPSYQPMDNITSRITYYNHEEKKTPILHGSRPVNGDYLSLGGATSQGDFENMLRELFDPASRAHFEWEKWTTLRGRLTMIFSFQVARDHSQFKLGVPDRKQEIITAYSGLVYLDAEAPHAVTKVVTKAEEIPLDFPIQKAETTLDYQYAEVGDRKFLLPFNEKIDMDNGEVLTRNANSFQHYRKYEVGSEISYDIPKDLTPVPDADLKETAPVKPPLDCKDPKNKDAPACKGKQ